MQVKKERIHLCGLSNIDFKRLSDNEKLKKFSDDMRTTNFGLMGRTCIAPAYESCGFGNRQSLKVHAGFKILEPPNPRHSETQNYYKEKKKSLYLPSEIQKKRVFQLEDKVCDGKVFTGEDTAHKTWFHSQVVSPKGSLDLENGIKGKILGIENYHINRGSKARR